MSGLQLSCRQVEPLIQGVADGVGTERERAAVEAHVAACARCRQTLTETQRLCTLLANQPARATSDEFEQRLMQALATRVPEKSSPLGGAWERFRLRYEWKLRTPALCAAGSLAVVLLAVTVAPRLDGLTHPLPVQRFVTSQIPRQDADLTAMDWDSVQASVDLSTGSVLDQ